jgi:fibronectin type 3 domain-containing protein
MSAKSLFLASFVFFGALALVAGCGSDPVAPIEDEAPILPPMNVTVTSSETAKLIVEWDPNAHPRLAGYHVYRQQTDTQETVRLTASPITNTYYEDMSAERGVGYEYRVTALTKAGKESVYTSIAVMLQADERQNPNRQF